MNVPIEIQANSPEAPMSESIRKRETATSRDMYGYNGEKLEYRFFVAGPFHCEADRDEMLEMLALFQRAVSKMPIQPLIALAVEPEPIL